MGEDVDGIKAANGDYRNHVEGHGNMMAIQWDCIGNGRRRGRRWEDNPPLFDLKVTK